MGKQQGVSVVLLVFMWNIQNPMRQELGFSEGRLICVDVLTTPAGLVSLFRSSIFSTQLKLYGVLFVASLYAEDQNVCFEGPGQFSFQNGLGVEDVECCVLVTALTTMQQRIYSASVSIYVSLHSSSVPHRSEYVSWRNEVNNGL